MSNTEETIKPDTQRQNQTEEIAADRLTAFESGLALGALDRAAARHGGKVAYALLGVLADAAQSGVSTTAHVAQHLLVEAETTYRALTERDTNNA